MTQEEILDYNKRCAEFLTQQETLDYYLPQFGLYICRYGEVHYEEVFGNDELKFHSDWNWIMEVVDAIEKLADWSLECLNYSDEPRDYQMMIPLSNTNIINKDKKEAVVNGINQFLIWYNENN